MLTHQSSLERSEQKRAQLDRRPSIDKQLQLGSSFGQMFEKVHEKAASLGLWCDEMQRDLPKKWEKHGDMIVFPQGSFGHQNWRYIGRNLWRVIAEALKVRRLGRKRCIGDEDDGRTPHVDLLYGDDGWVEHVDERGIRYIYDATKRVFNVAKAHEMRRVSRFECAGETVVDMYAVHAIDWDEDTVEALIRSRHANGVEETVNVIQGDARRVCPQGVADRVYLGLIPSCHAHWLTAAKALSPEGGVIHVQESVNTAVPRTIPPRVREKKPAPTKLASVDEGDDGDGVAPPPSTSNETSNMPTTEKEASTKTKKPPLKTMKAIGSIGNEKENVAETTTVAPEDKENAAEARTGQQESTTAESGDAEAAAEPAVDDDAAPRLRRKFSRSSSIVEEMENRVLPTPAVVANFQAEWKRLPLAHREFAMECANSVTRFLNNIHPSDDLYFVLIVQLTKLSSSKTCDVVVLDLLAAKDDATASRLLTRAAVVPQAQIGVGKQSSNVSGKSK